MDMLKVHEERQLQSGTLSKASTGSSKRKPPKYTNEMESQLEINAVHRDQEEKDEQERIKRKVQKIRAMDEKRQQMHKKIGETVTAGATHVDGENQ